MHLLPQGNEYPLIEEYSLKNISWLTGGRDISCLENIPKIQTNYLALIHRIKTSYNDINMRIMNKKLYTKRYVYSYKVISSSMPSDEPSSSFMRSDVPSSSFIRSDVHLPSSSSILHLLHLLYLQM